MPWRGSWQLSRFQSTAQPKIDIDTDKKQSDLWFNLQMLYKDSKMNPKTKALRLKDQLIKLINTLPNGQFSREQLPLVNQVVNFIDQGRSPTQYFSNDEMITVLRSVLPAMTLQDIHYMDFFPRFYTALRDTKQYASDRRMRLELFEIFINYAMLSGNRRNLAGIVDAFIDEETTIRHDDVKKQAIDIVLEAFQTAKPDMATVVHLGEICNDQDQITPILANFFTAADMAIAEDYEDHSVSEQLLSLLNVVESKVQNPFKEYVNLLYYATKNSLDDCSLTILEKLSTLTSSFTDIPQLKGDELMAIVSSALKFGKLEAAARLVDPLKPTDKEEWTAYLQYHIYTSDDPVAVVKDVNSKTEFTDIEAYNTILDALCWSNKSDKVIDEITDEFEQEYNLVRDARSYATLIEYYLPNDVRKAEQVFEHSLEDSVSWDDDYGGVYMLTLFKLLTKYFDTDGVNLYDKSQLYKKIKIFEYPLDKPALEAMVSRFLQGDYVGDAMEIFEREVPDGKHSIEDYPGCFKLYYKYAVTSCENLESNWLLYQFLSKHFTIPYQFYPGFLRFWVDVGYPDKSLRVFANMKQLSKESKLPPLDEDVYIFLLQAFSKFQYERGIFTLQLAVKMDLSLNPDVKLFNALMEGFCSLEDSFKVRDVFNDAQALPASYGINNESCYWALKSLKYSNLGEVNSFYYNLSQYDVFPDSNLFGEYLIANCYFEQYGTAYDKLIESHENGDMLIDRNVLRDVYNFCLNDSVRGKLDTFATEKYPRIWAELKNSGELTDGKKQPSLLTSPYETVQLKMPTE